MVRKCFQGGFQKDNELKSFYFKRIVIKSMDTIKDFYNLKKYSLGLNTENVHQKIIRFVGSGSKILDVGCANGYLSKLIKEKGNAVSGIEISEIAAKEAKGHLDELIVGNIEHMNLPWPEQHFDIIICADVLEHLFDPSTVLVKLRKVLKDNGVLILSIPNIAYYGIRKSLLLGRFEYSNTGTLDRGHIRFFTFATAERMLKEAGYQILKSDCILYLPEFINRSKAIHNIIYRLSKKYFSNLLGYQFLFMVQRKLP